MRKYWKFIVIFISILIIAIVLIITYYSKKPNSITISEKIDDTSRDIDLEGFKLYEKSHFGFMHPRTSFPFAYELNVHWQRNPTFPFVWDNVEISEGKYDWEETDNFIKESYEYDTLIISTIWPYADWDQETCHSKLSATQMDKFSELGDYRRKPCDLEAYSNFLIRLVERYDGDGESDMPGLKYPIRYWEIMSEPDLDGVFFKGDDQSGEYLEILELSYNTIKATDPSSTVLIGGMTSLDGKNLIFWEDIQDQGGFEYTDLFSIHPIGSPADLHFEALSNFMTENNLQGSIWITELEFGISDESPNIEDFNPAITDIIEFDETFIEPPILDNLSEDEWAVNLVKVYVKAFEQGTDKIFYVGLDNISPGEKTAFLVNCEESDLEDLDDFEDTYDPALCEKQKPFYSFQTLVEKIDYFDTVEKISEGQYKFTVNQNTIYILWGEGNVPYEITGEVILTDIYGQSERLDTDMLELSDKPIYIEIAR